MATHSQKTVNNLELITKGNHNMELTIEAKHELLKDEYAALYNMIDSFDDKTLTIKTWSVTVSMSGIGVAFLSHAPSLLVLSALSAMMFWIIEAKWKIFQGHYFARISEIESYFEGIQSSIVPFQISASWERQDKNKSLAKFVKKFFFFNVMLPHAIVFLCGAILFILSLFGFMTI